MPRRKNDERSGFGAKLRELRDAAGYTPQELAHELGVARRMTQIERMNPKDKRQVLQILDAWIEREQLRASKG